MYLFLPDLFSFAVCSVEQFVKIALNTPKLLKFNRSIFIKGRLDMRRKRGGQASLLAIHVFGKLEVNTPK